MTKALGGILIAGLLLVGSSMATLLAEPSQPAQTRRIIAGKASLQVPAYFPKEIVRGTAAAGSAILSSKGDCDITYDQFLGIYWSNRPIPDKDLLPAAAYTLVSSVYGAAPDLGNHRKIVTRSINLSAEKPCGRIVKETLMVVELHCDRIKTRYAVSGMVNPAVTREKIMQIAQSLQCP